MIMKNPSKNSRQNPQPNSHGHVEEIFTDFFCRVGSVTNTTLADATLVF